MANSHPRKRVFSAEGAGLNAKSGQRIFLAAFWPFFTGIVVQLVGATFQFARMILALPE